MGKMKKKLPRPEQQAGKNGHQPAKTPAALGLGLLVQSEGVVRSERRRGRVVKRVTKACSCQGLNTNCFKCNGTGYCEVELAVDSTPPRPAEQLRAKLHTTAKAESNFSNDPRGGDSYGIRENGRFGSNPLHDDHS